MTENEQPGQGADKDIPPWLQPVPEEEETGGFFEGRKTLLITAGAAVTVVALFVVVLLYLYDGSSNEAPRYVAADTTPVREKPEDAGGMDVPHQDKQVFDQGAGASAQVALSAQPEQPLETLPEEPEVDDSHAEDEARIAAEAEARAREIQEAEKREAEAEVARQKAAAEEAAKAAAVPEGSFKVQLGAYGSEDGAARAWRTVRGKYPSILEGLSPFYEAVQSGDRTLYRLRLGPLMNRAAADEVCLGLRAQQQACIVVNP
ncbi:MAG: SPOR domain-containing protein [Alphaproteobacteria bacterium]|nr:SPOR domain-containing protein [Alphaproteobacteria bacterium]